VSDHDLPVEGFIMAWAAMVPWCAPEWEAKPLAILNTGLGRGKSTLGGDLDQT
jgi:hypothetical protein